MGFIPARKGLNVESSSGGQVSEGGIAALCPMKEVMSAED
jgi:hypothetical protein